jgi:preprotein translocase subunit YajC
MYLAIFSSFMDQAPAAQPGSGSFLTAIVPFVLVFVIFYFLIIMPSRKKQKKHQEMVGQLKAGDKVITSGGLYGSVMGVQPDRIELKVASNVKIEVTKSAIAVIVGQQKQPK